MEAPPPLPPLTVKGFSVVQWQWCAGKCGDQAASKTTFKLPNSHALDRVTTAKLALQTNGHFLGSDAFEFGLWLHLPMTVMSGTCCQCALDRFTCSLRARQSLNGNAPTGDGALCLLGANQRASVHQGDQSLQIWQICNSIQ